jgi:hypothetical protein
VGDGDGVFAGARDRGVWSYLGEGRKEGGEVGTPGAFCGVGIWRIRGVLSWIVVSKARFDRIEAGVRHVLS